MGRRLTDVENLTKAILFLGVMSMVAIVVTVCAMVVDQMHFNNQTYRDQSQQSGELYQGLSAKVDGIGEQLDTIQQAQANSNPN